MGPLSIPLESRSDSGVPGTTYGTVYGGRCIVEGTNNIFSYLPRANLENFRDSFRYSTNDCKLQRPVHASTGQACTAQRFTTLHFETGAFQGTGGLVVQQLKVRILVKACGADLKWWRQD